MFIFRRPLISSLIMVGFGLLLTALFLFGLGRHSFAPVAAQTIAQADIVVQFDDHAQAIREIEFSGTISGLQALRQSGFRVETQSYDWGVAVCSIEGVGCPAEDCFCGGDNFWNYSYWDGSGWQSYPVGATASEISQTGTIEGWRWGAFDGEGISPYPAQAAKGGYQWLRARQVITDGGYGASQSAAVESALAIGANHYSGDQWRRQLNSPSLFSYLLDIGPTYAGTGVAAAGKLAVALNAVDGCWPDTAMAPADYYSPTVGAMSDQAGPLAWAILGSTAFSGQLPDGNAEKLTERAFPAGGWEWADGWGRDTNTTSLAIQALIAAGEPISATSVVSGLLFLKSAQNVDGGFPYDPFSSIDTASDVNSTAYAVQALFAAGEDPTGSAWTKGDQNPLIFLLARQQPDGGFAWQADQGANILATQQALPALLGTAYPLQPGGLSKCTQAALALDSSAGGVISATVGSTVVDLQAPAGAVSTPATLAIQRGTAPSRLGLHFAGQTFVINAVDTQGQTVTQFENPISLAVTYRDADVAGLDEAKLDIYYWNEELGAWEGLGAAVDPIANRLTVSLNHLSRFVIGAEWEGTLYLPVVQ